MGIIVKLLLSQLLHRGVVDGKGRRASELGRGRVLWLGRDDMKLPEQERDLSISKSIVPRPSPLNSNPLLCNTSVDHRQGRCSPCANVRGRPSSPRMLVCQSSTGLGEEHPRSRLAGAGEMVLICQLGAFEARTSSSCTRWSPIPRGGCTRWRGYKGPTAVLRPATKLSCMTLANLSFYPSMVMQRHFAPSLCAADGSCSRSTVEHWPHPHPHPHPAPSFARKCQFQFRTVSSLPFISYQHQHVAQHTLRYVDISLPAGPSRK